MIRDWRQRWNRDPTDNELAALVDTHIRDEILYREALRLELDKQDTIIRRRLVQKIEFLLESTDPLYRPNDTVLQSYLEKNAAAFSKPASVSLEHHFFSNDKRSDARKDASRTLADYRLGSDATALAVGDRFAFGERFTRVTPIDLERSFGGAFGKRVLEIAEKKWTGPIESAFGYHLVYVISRDPPLLADLESVRNELSAAVLIGTS